MKNYINFFKCSLILFLATLLNSFSSAADIPTYKVGLENLDYLPWYNTIASANFQKGACLEILDLFAQKNKDKFKFEFVPLPVSRLFQDFVDGSVDFKFPDNAHWGADLKKKLDVQYSLAVTKYTDGTLVLPENKGKGVEKLKTLGIVRGFTAWDYLGLIKEKKVTESESLTMDALIKKNLAGRVDGIYLNVAVALYQLEKMGSNNKLLFDSTLPHTTDIYSLSSIKHPKIIEEFNKFLTNEKSTISGIMKKYHLEN